MVPVIKDSEKNLIRGTKTDIGPLCQVHGRKLIEDQKRSSSEIRPDFCQKLSEDQNKNVFVGNPASFFLHAQLHAKQQLIECWSNYLSARGLVGPPGSPRLGPLDPDPGTMYPLNPSSRRPCR